MADPLPIEQLVHAYLDGVLSPSDRDDLAARIAGDPTAADVFARATRFEALLESYLVEERAARAVSAEPAVDRREQVSLPLRQTQRTWRIATMVAGLAAAVLV